MPQTQTRTRPQRMTALVFDGSLRVARLAKPQPGPGEALVRVLACAISRADVEMVDGARRVDIRPAILGHEFVGEVVQTREAPGHWVGRRVVAQLKAACGQCSACVQGRGWLCTPAAGKPLGFGTRDGAFAEWIVLPVSSLVELPENVDEEEGVFVHPLAAALAGARWVEGAPPQRVLVIGDGNMGLLTTLVLHAEGHSVQVMGRHPSRRDLLWRSGIGFVGVQEPGSARTVEAPPVEAESVNTVFECSGHPSGFEMAMAAVRPQGRIVLFSHHPPRRSFDLRSLVDREIEILGVNGGPLEEAVEMLSRKRIDTLPLVSGRFSLEEGGRAFDHAARRGAFKVILRPRSDAEGLSP